MIEMIPDERGFFVEDLNAIIIGDLHIGYEKELAERGIIVEGGTGRLIDRIRKILEKYDAKKLIIVGDVKHQIMGYEEDIKFLEDLDVKIIVVKGNHDGNIENMGNFEVRSSRGFRIGDFGFLHGHSWPHEEVMNAKYVFMGHIHPEIELKDSIGKIHKYPCHLVGKLTEKGREIYNSDPRIFVLAAFNPMIGSGDVDIGPLFRNKIVGDFEVYLLNGAYLGKYESLRFQVHHL